MLYPAYIDAAKTCKGGRRVPKRAGAGLILLLPAALSHRHVGTSEVHSICYDPLQASRSVLRGKQGQSSPMPAGLHRSVIMQGGLYNC